MARNLTGGGRAATAPMSPATTVMTEALELSDAAHGIPGGIETGDGESSARARSSLSSGASLEMPSSRRAVESEEEALLENESTQSTQASQDRPGQTSSSQKRKKRIRHDVRNIYAQMPLSVKIHNDHRRLIDQEIALAKARLSLVSLLTAHTKLKMFALLKNMTPTEIETAYAIEVPSEDVFMAGIDN
uniref:Uncharacterized protein n=1 Tax=Plectus sambesii TaxID=2011161 RepID=A0A914XAU2_9BILA